MFCSLPRPKKREGSNFYPHDFLSLEINAVLIWLKKKRSIYNHLFISFYFVFFIIILMLRKKLDPMGKRFSIFWKLKLLQIHRNTNQEFSLSKLPTFWSAGGKLLGCKKLSPFILRFGILDRVFFAKRIGFVGVVLDAVVGGKSWGIFGFFLVFVKSSWSQSGSHCR